jgi:hypothetical protein
VIVEQIKMVIRIFAKIKKPVWLDIGSIKRSIQWFQLDVEALFYGAMLQVRTFSLA